MAANSLRFISIPFLPVWLPLPFLRGTELYSQQNRRRNERTEYGMATGAERITACKSVKEEMEVENYVWVIIRCQRLRRDRTNTETEETQVRIKKLFDDSGQS